MLAKMDDLFMVVVLAIVLSPLAMGLFWSLVRSAVRLGVLQALRQFNSEQQHPTPAPGAFPVVFPNPKDKLPAE
jgi:hypothetical protein